MHLHKNKVVEMRYLLSLRKPGLFWREWSHAFLENLDLVRVFKAKFGHAAAPWNHEMSSELNSAARQLGRILKSI